uniref:Uncharacterized protein n=1 Tax=Salix viminalis TaxID=40686 RepID=A0A6N2K0Q1_SALVM
MGDLFVWLISFFIIISIIVIIIFQLMALADLEFDYINPYDSSSRINKVILPEYITEGVLCLALVYVTSVCSIPLLQCEAVSFFFFFAPKNYTLLTSENCCLSVYERDRDVTFKRRGGLLYWDPLPTCEKGTISSIYTRKQHLVDVTEIFNMLSWEKKQRLFKLGYLISLLFLSIFWMILTALEDSDYD